MSPRSSSARDTARSKRLLLAILLISLLAASMLLVRRGCVGNGRIFCGVTLSGASQALLLQVEQRYGKKVREEVGSALPQPELARSGVDPLGVPFVATNAGARADEATVVHELFHLKLISEGFPYRVVWDLSALRPQDDGIRYEQLKHELFSWILDPLSHRAFYPGMRAMNLSPNAHQREFLQRLLGQGRERRADWTPETSVLTYFSLALEMSDSPELVRQLADWYVTQGWSGELATAQAMVALEQDVPIRTPDDLIREFIRCANLFLQGRATLEFRGWMPVEGTTKLAAAAFSVNPPPVQPILPVSQ